MITLSIDQSFIEKGIGLKEMKVSKLQDLVEEEFKDKFTGNINISYVSDVEIRRLNRMYRNKDTITDVLSFSYLEKVASKREQLGDIVISYEQAKRQAQGDDVELELVDLMIHGILHVLGYDHEKAEDAKEMFPLQDRLVKTLL